MDGSVRLQYGKIIKICVLVSVCAIVTDAQVFVCVCVLTGICFCITYPAVIPFHKPGSLRSIEAEGLMVK